MPSYTVAYDLSAKGEAPHKPFLTEAEKVGLLYVFRGSKYVSRLPNTTLWGHFASRAHVIAAFEKAISKTEQVVGHRVTVEKRLITKGPLDWEIMSDVRKVPNPEWIGQTKFETSRLHQLNDPLFR